MAKIKLPIQLYRGSKLLDSQTVMLGEAHVKRWNIQPNSTLTLRFGSGKWTVRVIPVSGIAALRISEGFAEQSGLMQGLQLCARYKPASRTLQLGPLIGVMVSRIYASRPESPFGTMTGFCRELSEACSLHGGTAIFFMPGDLPSGGASSMNGWSLRGRWVKRSMPLPDVVYNRLTSRRLENNPSVQHFMKDVKSRFGAKVFNEKYLNKTEVFQALRQDSALHAYLPESYLFKNFAMLKTMLDRYPSVFLKPITGSLGKGIIRVSRQGESIVVHATHLGGIRKQTFPTLTAAFQSFSGKLRQQKYQIQQGLSLMEVGGRPVDYRALVQKGATDEWKITSIVARIAPGDSIVSNVAQGGTLSSVKEALAKSSLPVGIRSSLMAKLRKASLEIAAGVEKRIPAHFGELGIDLAADRAGRVWLLEVNSKPSKDDNTPLSEGKIRPSVRRLIEYSQLLADF